MDMFMCLGFMILGTLPALPNADICNENLVSGPSPVPDHSITASSVLMNGSGPDRSRLNTPEVMDAQGVTQMGAWVAEQSDLNQWIQVELTAPSLVRGITTQGRNGGYKEWVEKFRVFYSTDSQCRKWVTVAGCNVTDTFFKANTDEDSTVTNMFHCPVIARCIRVNPLAWTNHIALRLELIGCSLNTGPSATKPTAASTTKAPAITTGALKSTFLQGEVAQLTTPKPGNTGWTEDTGPSATKPTAASTTKAPAITTGALKSTFLQGAVAQLTTPKPGNTRWTEGCVKSCKGMQDNNYQSCKSCDQFVTCMFGGFMIPDRRCSKILKWNRSRSMCSFESTSCP